jgi:hypothetical protein
MGSNVVTATLLLPVIHFFNGVDQYAWCADETVDRSFDFTARLVWNRAGQKETRHVSGKDFKSPEIYDSNFLIEVYFKTTTGNKGGVLVEKMEIRGIHWN